MDRQEPGRWSFEDLPDPNTDPRLLPSALVAQDNSRRVKHLKMALGLAMERCLTPVQREQMALFYEHNLRKSQIAAKQNVSCSAVSKSMKAAQASLRDYIELYMQIFSCVEQEFLRDENT